MHMSNDTACSNRTILLFSGCLPQFCSRWARGWSGSAEQFCTWYTEAWYMYWYIHLKYWAPAHTACSCFAAHESNPAAELAMSSSVLLWHSWRYYSGTSQSWLYLLCFPTNWRDELSPISWTGKWGGKRGAEGSIAMGTVQVGMPKLSWASIAIVTTQDFRSDPWVSSQIPRIEEHLNSDHPWRVWFK